MVFFFLFLQLTSAKFHEWKFIVHSIISIVISLFIGSWSDRRGRKIPLLIGLIGKLIEYLGFLLNIYFGMILLYLLFVRLNNVKVL